MKRLVWDKDRYRASEQAMFAQLLPCPGGEGRDGLLQLVPFGDIRPECPGDGQALALRREQRERQAGLATLFQ